MHKYNHLLTYMEFQRIVNPWRMPSAFTNSDDNNQLFKLEIQQATAGNSVAKYSSDENNLEASKNNSNHNIKSNVADNSMDVYDIANVKGIFPQGIIPSSSLLSTTTSSSSTPSCIPVITPITITTPTSENVFEKSNANDVINSMMTEIANIDNIELNANDLLTTTSSSSKNAATNIANDDILSNNSSSNNNNNNNEITKSGYNNDTTIIATTIKEKGAAAANNLNVTCEQGNTPLKQIIITIEHKIRNLEKRKTKLESYREIQAYGKDLSNDQKLAVAKYDAVASTLDFARSLSKQIVQISKEAEKEQKKQARKDLVLKAQAETAKIREVLILQNTIAKLKEDSVREAFRNGSYGAIKLEPSDLNALEKFFADVNLDGEETSNDITQNAQKCAELYSMTIDGRPKQYHQNVTYEKMHEIFEKIHKCGYLEKLQNIVIVKSKQQNQHAELKKSEQNMQHGEEEEQQQHHQQQQEEQQQQQQQQQQQLIEQQHIQQQKLTPQAPPAAVLPVFQGQNIPSSISPVYNQITGLMYTGMENTNNHAMQSPNGGGDIITMPLQSQQQSSKHESETQQFVGQVPTNVCNVEQAYFKQHRQFMQQMRPLAEVIGNGNFYFLQDSEVDSPDMGINVCGTNMQNNLATSPLSSIFIEQQTVDNVLQHQQQQQLQQQQSLITSQTFTNQSFPQMQAHQVVVNKSPTAAAAATTTAVELQQQQQPSQHALFSPVSSVNSQQSVTSTTKSQQQQQQAVGSLAQDMQTTIVATGNVINIAGNNKSPKLSNTHVVMGVMHANDVTTPVAAAGGGVGVLPAIVGTPTNVAYAFDNPTLYRSQLEQQQQHHHHHHHHRHQHQMIKTSPITEKPLTLNDKLDKNTDGIAALTKKDIGELSSSSTTGAAVGSATTTTPSADLAAAAANAWNSPLNSALHLPSSNVKVSTANAMGVVADVANSRHNANRNNNNKWSSNNSNNEWSAVTTTTATANAAAAAVNNSNSNIAGAFGDSSEVNHWKSNAAVNTPRQQQHQPQIDNMNAVGVGNYGRGNARSGSNHRRNDERNQRTGGSGGYRNRNNNNNNYGNSMASNANGSGGGGSSTTAGAMGDGVNNNNNNNSGGGNRNNGSGVFFRNNENAIGMGGGNGSATSYFQNGANTTNIYGGNGIKETTSRFHNDYRSGSRSGGANNGARSNNNNNNHNSHNSATRSLLRGGNNNNNNGTGGGTNNNNNNNSAVAPTTSTTTTSSGTGTGTAEANTYMPARPSYRIP